jgi:hypothetical protein
MSNRSKNKAPLPWADEDVVYKLVQAELEENSSEEDRQFYLLPWETHPGVPADEIISDMEHQALDAWRRGDLNPLTDLLRPEHPFNNYPFNGRLIRDQLSAEAWSLICDRLLGKKRKRGRPKMTAEERRMHNPIHDMSDRVPAIENILRQHHPDQPASQVKERARAFAERLMGKDDPESAGSKVSDHLNRSKKDRARLP